MENTPSNPSSATVAAPGPVGGSSSTASASSGTPVNSSANSSREATPVPSSVGMPDILKDSGGQDVVDSVSKSKDKALPDPTPKKWKLKVDDKDIEIDSEEELIKKAQMGYSADKKWQEAAKMRKDLEDFVGLMQSDLGQAISLLELPIDIQRKFVDAFVERDLKEFEKTPEQKAQEKMQQELLTAKEKLALIEKEKEEARVSDQTRKYVQQFDQDISKALEASELPKSPYYVKRIADVMKYAMGKGMKGITVQKAVEVIKNENQAELKDFLGKMSVEQLENYLGKDIFEKMRQKRVDEIKKVQATTPAPIQDTAKKSAPKPIEKMSARDFFRKIGTI